MATLFYMVGIVGVGKTTVALRLMNKYSPNALFLDSDAIRGELFNGDEACQDNPSLVFATMEKRTIAALNKGQDVIYCACNIWAKKRINFLKALSQKVDAVRFQCYVINCSIETARKRNSARSRIVPSYVFDKQIRQFEIPTYGEGWHSIEIIDNNDSFNDILLARKEYEKRVMEFGSQQNSHHILDLYDHCRMAAHYAREHNFDESIVEAAWLHDWGKAWTATRWEKDNYKELHFPNHGNVSAILALNMGFSLEVIALVNYHMLLYTDFSCQKTWKARLGERMWDKLIKLHQADEAAH